MQKSGAKDESSRSGTLTTGQISRLTSRLEPTASLAVHAQRAARTAVRIRRDSSGMLRSVRASGAWTGSRDAIHDMWAEGVESYVRLCTSKIVSWCLFHHGRSGAALGCKTDENVNFLRIYGI